MAIVGVLLAKIKSWFAKAAAVPAFPAPIPKPQTITARLLQFSYFPTQRPAKDELPPVFESVSFLPSIARQVATMMPKKGLGFDAVEYRLTRADGQIRASHIPHPLAYANLVLTIEKHWALFPDVFNNYHSYIRPRLHPDGRLIIMKYDSWLTKTLKALGWKLRAKYVAHVDIANFFPSIYTHSFGWAIAGMQVAKKSKGKAWYDDVDKALRDTKRSETNGVLIGPGTSNIATEVILGKIDAKLSAKGFRFFRHIDDYKCYCETREDAERFVAEITRQLGFYKLSINSRKSKITPLPAADIDAWVSELRLLTRHLGKKPSSGKISFFLDCVTTIVEKFGEANAYKYAATVLSSKRLNQNAKVTAFIHLLGLSQFAPNITSCLLRFLPDLNHCKFHRIGPEIIARLREAVKFGRSDVITWLIYLATECGEAIPDDIAGLILNRRDCVPSTLLYAVGDAKLKKRVAAVARSAVKSPDSYDAHSQ